MTLAELLVTIAILTVVSTALTGLIQSFYKDNAYLMEQTAALASARKGVSQAIGDIREASYGDDGSYLISAAGTSTLTLYSDIDRDSYVERVKYTLLNGTLYRTVAQAAGSPPSYAGSAQSTTTVATDVRNTDSTPLFTYFDASGAQLSTTSPNIATIASVRIMLLVDLNPARAPNVFTLMEMASMRNLPKE